MSPRARISLGISLVEGVSGLEELRRDGERRDAPSSDWFDFDGKRADVAIPP